MIRSPSFRLFALAALALLVAYQFRAPIQLEMASADEEVYLRQGFYPPEVTAGVTHRWTSGAAQIYLPGLGGGAPLQLRLSLQPFRPAPVSPSPVTIRLNGRDVARFTPSGDLAAYTFELPPLDLRGAALIDLQSDAFVPSQTMDSTDERALGLFVDRVEVGYGPGVILPPLIVWALLILSVLAAYAFGRIIGWNIRLAWGAALLVLIGAGIGVVFARTWTAHNSPWLAGTWVGVWFVAWRLKRAQRVDNSQFPIPNSQFLRSAFTFILPVFLAWRVALVLIPIVGSSIVGVRECCPPVEPEPVASLAQAAFGHWYRWDAIWYGSIARDGYEYFGEREASNVAFFPLFPLVDGLIQRLTGLPVEVAGPLVSTALAFAACLVLYRLVLRETDNTEVASRAVAYWLAFPAAYYLAIGYSEALYALCVLAAFWWAREGRWGWCGVAAFLAALARLHGALLIVPLGYEYLRQRGFRIRDLRADAATLLAAPLGVLTFMGYLGLRFGQPLAYFEIQALFFKGIRAEAFPTFPGATLARYLHGALTNPPSTEGVIVVGAMILLLILTLEAWARLPRVYGVYMLSVALFSLLSGDLISMPRFVVPMFPGFIALAQVGHHPWADRAILLVSALLQGVLVLLFTNGYWIA
ncbi:MAG TPA: mannosyltransferase family protein [Anaerolineae bacterium]|nr:mannosyltransferase family protein [Anaerolineae bacterium]